MPPRTARGRTRGVSRYPVRSHVLYINNLAQWSRLQRRGKNNLIFVLFTLDFLPNSNRLRSTVVELSGHQEFQDVVFAIIDIEKAKEVADQEGIHDAPTFVCYQMGAVVDKLERVSGDSAPSSLWQMLHRNAVRVRAEAGRTLRNATPDRPWVTMLKAVAYVMFIFGAILAVAAVQPVEHKESEQEKPKKRRSRNRYSSEESSEEDE